MDLNGTKEVSITCWCVPCWIQFSSSPWCAPLVCRVFSEILSSWQPRGASYPDPETLWSSSAQFNVDHSHLAVPQSLVECKMCWEDAQGLFSINMLCSCLIPPSLALLDCPSHASALAGYFGKVWLELSSYTPLKVLFYNQELSSFVIFCVVFLLTYSLYR